MAMFEFDDQFSTFDITPVENLFIDEYMLSAPGDFVKVYIYALRQLYHPPRENSYEKMAKALCMEPDDVRNAFTYWERQGVLRRVSDNPPSYKMFNLKTNLLMQKSDDDGLYRYRDFNNRVQNLLPSGRLLHAGDTKYLYDWIEIYKLPESVVLILVEHLLKKRGPKVRFANCDKIARQWAENGINTEEAAREQVRYDTDSYAMTRRILQRLGIRANPTPEQERMYAEWLSLGFDNAAILECCKQTASARNPNMGYLDSIIRSMNEKGLHTVQQISDYMTGYKENVTHIRAVYRELGQSVPIGIQPSIDMYRQWQSMGFSDEAIIITARALKRMNSGTFEMMDKAMHRMKDDNVIDEMAVSRYYDEIFTYADISEAILLRLALQRRSTAADREAVKRWSGEYGMGYEMLLLAADRARDVSGNKFAYMDGILRNWRDRDIMTPEAVARDEAQRRVRPAVQDTAADSAPAAVGGYSRHAYTDEELKGMYTDIMKGEGDD